MMFNKLKKYFVKKVKEDIESKFIVHYMCAIALCLIILEFFIKV
jgi:hypothetical protein